MAPLWVPSWTIPSYQSDALRFTAKARQCMPVTRLARSWQACGMLAGGAALWECRWVDVVADTSSISASLSHLSLPPNKELRESGGGRRTSGTLAGETCEAETGGGRGWQQKNSKWMREKEREGHIPEGEDKCPLEIKKKVVRLTGMKYERREENHGEKCDKRWRTKRWSAYLLQGLSFCYGSQRDLPSYMARWPITRTGTSQLAISVNSLVLHQTSLAGILCLFIVFLGNSRNFITIWVFFLTCVHILKMTVPHNSSWSQSQCTNIWDKDKKAKQHPLWYFFIHTGKVCGAWTHHFKADLTIFTSLFVYIDSHHVFFPLLNHNEYPLATTGSI